MFGILYSVSFFLLVEVYKETIRLTNLIGIFAKITKHPLAGLGPPEVDFFQRFSYSNSSQEVKK
jgi:hypothetical protein